MITLEQRKSGNIVVLQYKLKNGRIKSFVNVPVSETENSFEKYSAWIDTVIKINCSDGTKFKSAKRMMEHLFQRYGKVFKHALKDLRISTTDRMGVIQVVTMFKAVKEVDNKASVTPCWKKLF